MIVMIVLVITIQRLEHGIMPDGKLGTKVSACDNDYSAFYQETGAGRWSYCYCFDIVVIIVIGTMTTRGLVLENVFVNLIAQHFIRIFSFPFPENPNFQINQNIIN